MVVSIFEKKALFLPFIPQKAADCHRSLRIFNARAPSPSADDDQEAKVGVIFSSNHWGFGWIECDWAHEVYRKNGRRWSTIKFRDTAIFRQDHIVFGVFRYFELSVCLGRMNHDQLQLLDIFARFGGAPQSVIHVVFSCFLASPFAWPVSPPILGTSEHLTFLRLRWLGGKKFRWHVITV